ncbi:MAG: hypothetical protein DSZ28_07765 [Thiothrix sp.]|nr:MAG: hypothetical protein DSZ28_07765 [Thiothrix sp.]
MPPIVLLVYQLQGKNVQLKATNKEILNLLVDCLHNVSGINYKERIIVTIQLKTNKKMKKCLTRLCAKKDIFSIEYLSCYFDLFLVTLMQYEVFSSDR